MSFAVAPARGRRVAISVLAFALLPSLASPATAAERFHTGARNNTEYYIQTYGRVDPARLSRVYSVFDNVRAVADKSSGLWPELIVVNDKQQAAAFVLADGSIVLSQRALDIIATGVDTAMADARLAFIIGHELAHLAANDFWDHEIGEAFAGRPSAAEVTAAIEVTADKQKKELKADDLGFVYAALAGYAVERLVQSSSATQDFLTYWTNQIGAQADATYPSAAARSELLRVRLEDRLQSLQAFHFGVRLLHFGRYREGLALLREFQQQFPSREVFNDLGYGHLQQALERMPPELAYHYWLPGLADLHTPLSRLTLRASAPTQGRTQWRIAPAAREDLLDAARYFELAIAKDSRYAPAHVNLAMTHLLLGLEPRAPRASAAQLLRAESASAAAQALAPNDPQIRVLAAIVRFEREQIEGDPANAPRPSQALESDDPALNYNLARLYAGTPDVAARYWTKSLGQFDALPVRVRALICAQSDARVFQAGEDVDQQCARARTARPATTLPWPVPIQLSRDLLDHPLTDAERAQFDPRQIQLARSKVFSGSTVDLLTIDDITAMAVLKNANGSNATLLQCCGQPATRQRVASGELWRYDTWIAWLRDGRIREVWIID
jgi:hypothetical protein